MADFDPQPVNTGTSKGFDFNSQGVVADPFTASNMTWTEIENSTAADWAGFWVFLSANVSGIFQVAKGAASSEIMVCNLPTVINATNRVIDTVTYVPVPIPSGTRLSVACSASSSGVSCQGQVIGVLSADFDAEPAFTVMETGPYQLSNTGGTYGQFTLVDPGGTINTKGSYVELSNTGTNGANNILNGDSIDNDYEYFGYRVSNGMTVSDSSHNQLVDIAIGAASSEVISMPDLTGRFTTLEGASIGAAAILTRMQVLTGDRFSARAQSTITDATDRQTSVLLYGVR